MPSLLCVRSAILLCGFGLALASGLYAQTIGIAKVGEEFSASNPRLGDQNVSSLALGASGGYVVWQDNVIDGNKKSYGIAARRLNQHLQATNYPFRVNQVIDAPQENPQVTMMKNGGAAFVWQGGRIGLQDIYMRMVTPAGLRVPKTDLLVNQHHRGGQQSKPVITCLPNGNMPVIWNSLHQDGNMEGVFGRVMTPSGTFAGAQFRVNQFTGSNQRDPAVAALSNGNFVVVWLSQNQGVSTMETLRHTNRVHVYARVYTPGGGAVGHEFRVNTRSNLCASASVAPFGERGFTVAWAERGDDRTNSWDIYARTYTANNQPATDAVLVNDITRGDQFDPQIASVNSRHLVVWTGLELDGSKEGIFGRLLNSGEVDGPEFLVNTHTRGSQKEPAMASDKQDRIVVGWSSYLAESAYDIRAQQFRVATSPTNEPAGLPVTVVMEANRIRNAGTGTLPPLPPTGLAGTASISSTDLRVSLINTSKGKRLIWNTQSGRVYQVQHGTNFTEWTNLGAPRLAVAASDSMVVGENENAAFYRVIRLP